MTEKICIIDGINPPPSCHANHIHDSESIRELLELDGTTKLTLEMCDNIKNKNKREFAKKLFEA